MLHRNQSTRLSPGDRVLLSALNQDDGTLEQAVYVEIRKEDDAKENIITTNTTTTTSPPPSSPSVVLLLLVGVPGSGKSTFSSSLITSTNLSPPSSSKRKWIRVNQDTVKAGKRGTRAQCISAARTALEAGTSVIVDRCNVDQEQRRDFIHLAKDLMSVQGKRKIKREEDGTTTTGTGTTAGTGTSTSTSHHKHPVKVQLHCIVLDLPLEVCKQRAGDRKDHEGELQGTRAYAVVSRMYKQMKEAELPSQNCSGSGGSGGGGEGFGSVMHCQSDADIEAALHIWKNSSDNGDNDVKEQWQRYVGHDRKAAQGGGMKMKNIKSYFNGTNTDKEKKHGVVVEGGKKATNNEGDKRQQQQQQQQQRPSFKRKDAFQEMMTAAKKRPPSPPPLSKQHATTTTSSNSRHTFPYFPSVQVLANAADNPQQYASLHPHLSMYVDDHVVRIPDGYPKSRAHCLVIARDYRLDGPLDLIPSDVGLVKHMVAVGRAWASSLSSSSTYRHGFHAVPSCRRLHLHVVSDDLDSVYLKNKKHWNSFTTEFFLDADDVIKTLEEGKRLEYKVEEKEELLKRDMKCHKCGEVLRNIPKLKEHLRIEHD